MTAAADLLTAAARAFRDGILTWGREAYAQPGDPWCRCALGAIAYAADGGDPRHDADPMHAGPAAVEAVRALAEYLADELGAPVAGTHETVNSDGREEFVPDPVETTGQWNDSQESEAPVIAALEAVAARCHPATEIQETT